MMQRVLTAALVLILVVAGVFLLWPEALHIPVPNPDPNHTHADFAVWINGEQLDFSDEKYMSGLSTDDATHDEADEYHHLHLHLHDEVGYVIHRHKPGLTLGEFFASIGFTMTSDCFTLDTGEAVCNDGKGRWTIVVNGDEVPFSPDYVFADLDRMLLSYDASDTVWQDQWRQMTNDACRYSKTCPWRGEPPAENCISDPTVPCVEP